MRKRVISLAVSLFRWCLIWVAVLIVFGIAVLSRFEFNIPPDILARLLSNVSTDEMLVTAEAASFWMLKGVKIERLRVFDRKKTAAPPILSAVHVDAELDFWALLFSPANALRSVTCVELAYPRLPDGYYIPDSIEFPGQTDFKETNEPLQFSFPNIRPFKVKLERPAILGVTPRSVEIASVSMDESSMRAEGFHLDWADTDVPMSLDGGLIVDIDQQIVKGEVRGLARQHNIMPLLVALEITNSYQFIEAFTHVERPVNAGCRFDVNLRNCDLHINLDLDVAEGRHHGVPFSKARGDLDIRVFVRDTYQNAHIVVGPVTASLTDGSALAGTVVYENTNDIGFVDFDVRSTATLSNALAIADVMTDGTLDCLVPESFPTVTLKGRLSVDPRNAVANDLSGTVSFDRGKLFGIPLRAASSSFRVKGTDIFFSDAFGAAAHGGSISGSAVISAPGFTMDGSSYHVDIKAKDLSLGDMADAFGFDAGSRRGMVEGHLALSGPLATNSVGRINGGGRISCKDGHLARMRLFAGLTDFLSDNVPGIASMVDQSSGSMGFVISNGVLHAQDVKVDGGVFSIAAQGSYSMPKDMLDFRANVNFSHDATVIGRIKSTLSWPFSTLTRLLVDIRVTGPIEDPTWHYNKNLLDRLK